jgi:hypothetical protein
MEVIKEEPVSDEDIHPVSSQNEYHLVDTKDNYPIHATFFVVKTETQVRFSFYPVMFWFINILCYVALLTVVQD